MDLIMNFISTGNFGPIRLDLTKTEVEEILGKPESVSAKAKPLLIKYGSLELAFTKDNQKSKMLVSSIHLYFTDTITLPSQVSLGECSINKVPNSTTLLREALALGINLKKDLLFTFDDQVCYVSDSNVSIIISVEGKENVLRSMHVMKKVGN